MRNLKLIAVLICGVLLAGCSRTPAPQPQREAAAELRGIPVQSYDANVNVPARANDGPAASFAGDLTIPDGTHVRPGWRFRKVWRLRNRHDKPVQPHRLPLDTRGSYGPLVVPDAILIPEIPPGESRDVEAVISVQPNAPAGRCKAHYFDPAAGMFAGPFCEAIVDHQARPLDPGEVVVTD